MFFQLLSPPLLDLSLALCGIQQVSKGRGRKRGKGKREKAKREIKERIERIERNEKR